MSLDLNEPRLQFAVETVRSASTAVRQVQRELVGHSITKDDRSPVTVADYAAQAIVGYRLSEKFPGETLVAEEDSTHLREPQAAAQLDQVVAFVRRFESCATAECVCEWIDRGGAAPTARFWTLDPIDGTKGFLRGDQYAVALAYIADGEVQLGVLGCPNLSDAKRPDHDGPGSIVVAVKRGGAWTQPLDGGSALKPLHVSDVSDASKARVLRSVDAGHTNTGRVAELMETLGIQTPPVLMDSQAKYAVMAAGEADLLFRLLTRAQPDYKEKIWDHAAGSLIVEEAGGTVTDLTGNRLDFTRGRALEGNVGILVTNGRLHEAAMAAIARVFGHYQGAMP